MFSVSFSFVLLRDFIDGWFYSVTIFQSRLFYSVMRFQSVLFSYKILYEISAGFHCQPVLIIYKILITVGFVQSQDFNGSWFSVVTRWSRDLNDGWFSVSVGFVLLWDCKDGWFCSFVLSRNFKGSQFYSVMRFQWRSALLGYEISMMVGFQCQLVLFCYENSKIVGFVPLFFL